MKIINDYILQSEIDFPFGNSVSTCAYLLKRKIGNILFYSSKFIENDFSQIHSLGGIGVQIVNHRDEATSYCDLVLNEFKAPLYCHVKEEEAILKKCKVGKVIEEGMIFSDIEAVHTPGHCPGSTCFLWSIDDEKILFTGDTFYPSNGKWCVAIKDGDQEEMISSLRKLLELEVTMILPSLFIGDEKFAVVEDLKKYKQLINDCIQRLENGECH
ncbi:hypothetical protein A9Q84_11145 [Halobacteriovorax marinus]|uniref:Metallo-beta-lactamase domain-containing protein n=1 Tax=Halobacteriovorax marinus TaxID=97084 RepID=A0A1Y5F812_9BACT|nr:hypothetical protein A9Q84_11145 [Halobacteriovorax marinus]